MTNASENKDAKWDKEFDCLIGKFNLLSLQQPGDIILVRTGCSLLSRLYQAVCHPAFGFTVQGWKRIPSHALFVVSPGLYLHAMPNIGVRQVTSSQYRLNNANMLAVFRRQFPAEIKFEEYQTAFSESAAWHYAQPYNYKLNLSFWNRETYSRSFCSQLVASIYERAKFPLFSVSARAVLPIHLANEFLSSEWLDVSADYKKFEEMSDIYLGDNEWLKAFRQGAELTLTLPYERAEAIKRFELALRWRERFAFCNEVYQRSLLSFKDLLIPLLGRKLQKKADIDINDFVASMIIVGLPSEDRFALDNTWSRENKRSNLKRSKKRRNEYLELCTIAMSYAVAASVYFHAYLNGEIKDKQRLITALSFHDDFLSSLREHEFLKMDPINVSSFDRDVFYLWMATNRAVEDLDRIRVELQKNVNPEEVPLKLELKFPLTTRWFKSGLSKSLANRIKGKAKLCLEMLLCPSANLIKASHRQYRFNEKTYSSVEKS